MSFRSTDLLSKPVRHHAGLDKRNSHNEEDGHWNQVSGLSTAPLLSCSVSKTEGRLDCANGACLRGYERNDNDDRRDIVRTRLMSSCRLQSKNPLPSQASPSSTAGINLAEHYPFQLPRLGRPSQARDSRGDGSAERSECMRGTCLVLGSCICRQREQCKLSQQRNLCTIQSSLRRKSRETSTELFCICTTDCPLHDCPK